jgi:tryptophan-rich sensory protein
MSDNTVAAIDMAFRLVPGLDFWLMVPYALWVAFASQLDFKTWQMNSGVV